MVGKISEPTNQNLQNYNMNYRNRKYATARMDYNGMVRRYNSIGVSYKYFSKYVGIRAEKLL